MKFVSKVIAAAFSLALFIAAPASAQVPSDGPALWKVADEDTTIYLFGTIHVLPDGLDWYDEDIAAALESADLVVKELGPNAFAPRKLRAALVNHGLLPEGPTLRERMKQEHRELFEAEIAKLGMDPETMDRFQPWFASTRIVLARLRAMGIDSSKGVEAVLDTKVPEIPRAGLETVDLQFGAFASVPFEGQMKQLMGSFVEPEELREAFDTMVTEWIEGDPEELAAIFNESTTESGLEKPLLYDRNANWAEWIETRLEQPGTVFMAVGAGHLAGKNSVQFYLNERDIGVERIQ